MSTPPSAAGWSASAHRTPSGPVKSTNLWANTRWPRRGPQLEESVERYPVEEVERHPVEEMDLGGQEPPVPLWRSIQKDKFPRRLPRWRCLGRWYPDADRPVAAGSSRPLGARAQRAHSCQQVITTCGEWACRTSSEAPVLVLRGRRRLGGRHVPSS